MSSTADDRTRGAWGGVPDQDVVEVVDAVEDDDEGVELDVEASYLDGEQLARVEALTHARGVLLVSGAVFGGQPKLEPWALTWLAEYILKGPEDDAEDDGGTDAASTDAEDDAPTDGGSFEPVDLRGFQDIGG